MSVKILLVEDELAIQSLILFHLNQAGYQTSHTSSAEGALQQMQQALPDLLLLDIMLPGISGLELLRRLRANEHTASLPIILLTARSEEEDKIAGLNTGGDDYMTKPFSPKELLLRIQAVLRRSKPHLSAAILHIGDLQLEPTSHCVRYQDQLIKLGPTEFRLLHFLMTHPNRLYSRTQLLDQIWGGHIFVGERTIDVHMRRLRLALKKTGYSHLLQTVHGEGYRLMWSTSTT